MIKGEYEYLKNLADFNLCAEHKTPLEVARHAKEACYVLRCSEDHYPDTLVHNPSLTEEYRQGAELPEPIQSNVKKGIAKRQFTPGPNPTDPSLALVPRVDLGTGELLNPDQVTALVDYAYKYNLDPYRGHVVIMYGKPYIGLDGYLFAANRSGKAYSLRSRPMTSLEVTEYKIEPVDFGWISELIFTDTGAKFTGTGIVTYDEMTQKSKRDKTELASPVVAKYPWLLAQKRAEWQALRRAFPIGEVEESNSERGNKS